MVTGLAGLLNKADVQAFDDALGVHTKAQAQTVTLPCRFTRKPERVIFDCANSDMHLSGVAQNAGGTISAQIDRLQVGHAQTALDLSLSGRATKPGQFEFMPKRGAGWIRLSDGRRWSRLQFNTLPTDQGSATITLIDDYVVVRPALAHLPIMTASIFDGSRALAELQAALGLPKREIMAGKLPPAVTP
jgi:hypothetical protein